MRKDREISLLVTNDYQEDTLIDKETITRVVYFSPVSLDAPGEGNCTLF